MARSHKMVLAISKKNTIMLNLYPYQYLDLYMEIRKTYLFRKLKERLLAGAVWRRFVLVLCTSIQFGRGQQPRNLAA